MAITYSLLSAAADNMAVDSAITTPSFTPANGSLLVVIGSALNPNGTGNPAISDSAGLTWTRHVNLDYPESWASHICIYTAPVATGQAMTVTWNSAPNANDLTAGLGVQVLQVTGHRTNAPVRQVFTDGGTGGRSGAYSGTLSQAPLSSSLVLTTCCGDMETQSLDGMTPGSGWSGVNEQLLGSYSVQSTQARTGSTSTSITMASFLAGWSFAIGGVEIEAGEVVASTNPASSQMIGL